MFNESSGREANTFSDVLVSRAQTHAELRAYVFLRDGEDEEATLTFGQLHRRALAVAERLVALSQPGERAVLLYPQGLEFIVAFFGCLYAGVVPVPVTVPNRRRSFEIVRGIAQDSGARWLLSSTGLLAKFGEVLDGEPGLAVLPRIDTELLPKEPTTLTAPVPRDASDTALLQYTSGSTGSPRGVVVTHANLLDNQQQIEKSFQHDTSSVVLSWLPMFHDMGLGTVLQALWMGIHCVLMSPSAFLQKPLRWLKAISRYRATSSGGPDFAYDLCVRRISAEDRARLDLSSWRMAYNGSEPVRAATLARFSESFAGVGFRPSAFHVVYGLAEATLFVSGGQPGDRPLVRKFSRALLERGFGVEDLAEDGAELVSCGAPWLGSRVTIVNPETNEECAPGHVGEIWVGGRSVAAGYWNKPADTEATFRGRTASGEGPFLRTGDLGFVHGGDLYITGRYKDLIIVRGLNHYPQDIETTVSYSHVSLEPYACAAFSVESDDGEQLVIVQEVKRSAVHRLPAEDVFRAIRNVVADAHGLHTHAIVLLSPGNLPRTTSGKVRRKACKQAFMQNALSALASSVFGAETVEASVEGTGVGERATAMMPSAASAARDVAPDSARSRSISAAQSANRLIDWLRRYGDTSTEAHRRDELRAMTPALMRDFGRQGLLGMQIGQQHGGLGLGHAETTRVIEQLAAIDMNAGLFVGLNNYLGIGPIARHATPTLRDALLPRLSQGAELAGFAFAEPANATHADAIASYAEPVNGSGWRLYGRKYASAGRGDGSLMNVFVRHRDRSGVTAFVVPQGSSGVVSLASTSAATDTQSLTRSRVVLDGVYVKHEHVLGEVGQGMSIAMDAMAHAHLAVAAACLGGMKRCAQLVFHYATQRQTTTGRLVAHPVTLAKLGRVTAGVTALECLVQQLALALDSGPGVPPEAFTVCKVVAPEMLWQVVDDLVQLLGRRGYVETPHIRDLVRDAQALRSAEGPSEVMSALLGARLMNGGREGIRRFVSDVLKAPEVEPLLERAVGALKARGAQRVRRDTAAVTYWEQARAGELATWIALLAAVEGRRRQASTGELERAATWTRANFERTLAALDSEQPATSEDDAITASVSAYAHSVGQIDPLLMWGEQPVHPAVAPDSVPPPSERSAPTPSRGGQAAGLAPAARTAERSTDPELRAWVVRWLSARLRVAENQVDPRRSFADHGLDSLAAVEFAKALSDHLGRALDETLLWNFATIDALVEYLEGSTPPRTAQRTAGPVTGSQGPNGSSGETDLEAEIARLEDELRRR